MEISILGDLSSIQYVADTNQYTMYIKHQFVIRDEIEIFVLFSTISIYCSLTKIVDVCVCCVYFDIS